MLLYYILERTKEYAKYKFVPDGNLREGVVLFYSDGRKEVEQDSPDDVKRYYAIHALNGINTDLDKGTVAWC